MKVLAYAALGRNRSPMQEEKVRAQRVCIEQRSKVHRPRTIMYRDAVASL
jgi:hypothetical protein